MKFEAFCREFPEARLLDVYRLVEAAMMAAYNGELELRLVQRNDTLYDAEPTVSAYASNHLVWGNGWEHRESGGEIWWSTSSGHQVRFVFTLAKDEHGWDNVDLERVEIGDDPSSFFYPRIRALCDEVGVECVVAPLPEESGE